MNITSMIRYTLLLSSMILLSACTQALQATPKDTSPAAQDDISTYVYECANSMRFVVQAQNHRVWLFSAKGTVELPRVPSASGIKYADGDSVFWRKGDVAILEMGDQRYPNCRNNHKAAIWEHAKLSGVDFRAVGNEPPWVLEIYNRNKIRLRTGYEGHLHRFADAQIEIDRDAGVTTYEAKTAGDVVRVRLKRGICRDSMSDETFETQVEIQLNQENYQGCGLPLH